MVQLTLDRLRFAEISDMDRVEFSGMQYTVLDLDANPDIPNLPKLPNLPSMGQD